MFGWVSAMSQPAIWHLRKEPTWTNSASNDSRHHRMACITTSMPIPHISTAKSCVGCSCALDSRSITLRPSSPTYYTIHHILACALMNGLGLGTNLACSTTPPSWMLAFFSVAKTNSFSHPIFLLSPVSLMLAKLLSSRSWTMNEIIDQLSSLLLYLDAAAHEVLRLHLPVGRVGPSTFPTTKQFAPERWLGPDGLEIAGVAEHKSGADCNTRLLICNYTFSLPDGPGTAIERHRTANHLTCPCCITYTPPNLDGKHTSPLAARILYTSTTGSCKFLFNIPGLPGLSLPRLLPPSAPHMVHFLPAHTSRRPDPRSHAPPPTPDCPHPMQYRTPTRMPTELFADLTI
ncbi:hypothetical protein BD779DRAFT_1478654 [Infundibulicybe gibba]|nr:hypothetical protein BD779DRAFT_1478654 [Infundibulicybe gibba]